MQITDHRTDVVKRSSEEIPSPHLENMVMGHPDAPKAPVDHLRRVCPRRHKVLHLSRCPAVSTPTIRRLSIPHWPPAGHLEAKTAAAQRHLLDELERLAVR